jgi:hypothetical protein
MVIAQPDKSHWGRFFFIPILAKKEVINSTGHIMHQILPKKMARIMMRGHQNDQTIKLPTLVFLSCLMKLGSEELASNPVIIKPMKTTSEMDLSTVGTGHLLSRLFIDFNIVLSGLNVKRPL